jgi:hypothetical protein
MSLLALTLAILTPVQPAAGWHIPWLAGGDRIINNEIVYYKEQFPNFPVKNVRLWDTRTAWLHLNPKKDLYVWDYLDSHLKILKENNVENVTLVIWGTPSWAASFSDPSAANWLGPGSNSPPSNTAYLTDFVTELASRYKNSGIKYEIGNEFNVNMFFNSDTQTYVNLLAAAATAIKTADPSAKVVAGGPVVTHSSQVSKFTDFFHKLSPYSHLFDGISYHYYPEKLTRKDFIQTSKMFINLKHRFLPQTENIYLTEFNTYDTKHSCDYIVSKVLKWGRNLDGIFFYAYGYDINTSNSMAELSSCTSGF